MQKLGLSAIEAALQTSQKKQKTFESVSNSKVGRERKEESKKANKHVACYITEEQYTKLKELSGHYGISQFVRQIILDYLDKRK